jgi:hypothetical protein
MAMRVILAAFLGSLKKVVEAQILEPLRPHNRR